MANYPGYANAYGGATGGDIYISSLVNGFASYVDQYSDIANSYNGWVNDSSNIHWADYVRLNGDLEQAWRSTFNNGSPTISRWDWGWNHYQQHGKNESRVTPKVIDTPGGGGRDDMVTVIVNSWDKGSQDSKAAFGQYHFNRPEVQSNEDRIVPGYGPTVTISNNGNSLGVEGGISTSKGEDVYKKVVQLASNTSPGNYKNLVNDISNTLGGSGNVLFKNFASTNQLKTINAYYQTAKVGKPWDAVSLGAQPPTGGFDSEYYRLNTEGGRIAASEWDNALSSVSFGGSYLPDLDVTGKYTRNTYLQWYYTTQGKAAGERGNAAVTAKEAENYNEIPMTDAQHQLYRDQVMGLGTYSNLKEWEAAQDPEFLNQWIASLSSADREDRANGYLTIPSVTQIPEKIRSQAKMSRGDTILEGKLTTVLGPKEQEAADKFRSLTVDSFNETLREYKKQRAKEQEYDFYRGMSGFDEIFSINQELSNSLLGDTGVGGILSLGGQDQEKAQDSLENQFSAITGIPSKSSAVYNWQKWFDETLTKRYEEGAAFEDWGDESKQYTIDKEFAEDYITRYLNPRFNTSRSMSEFMSYMDVTQGEENIFQTQSALNSLKTMADIRAKQWLDTIRTSGTSGFDSEFYFNPSGGDVAPEKHLLQATKVTQDWEEAKKNGEQVVPGSNPPYTWNQLAYFYGYNINDKTEFAKLHYQVYGIQNGFDPARDKLSMDEAQAFIDKSILPAITDEKLNLNNVSFLNFVTPKEYADKMLEGIDPLLNKTEWEKILESMGLSGKDMGIDEVKAYIEEAFQTGEATKIREAIKFLNEKKEKVTQEKLGVDYIERPEDTAPRADPTETELYNVFKSAGFAGTEDDFYKDFMPDVNREDMELLTQAGQGFKEGSVFSKLSSSDPFESLGSIESLFGDEEAAKETAKTASSSTEKKSYFNLYDDDDDEDTTTAKSNAGQSFLGSFTSAFKNLTPKY